MTELINKYCEYLEFEKRSSPKTVKAYRADLEALFEYTTDGGQNSQIEPKDITVADIRSYIMFLCESGMNPNSVNRHITALRVFFKYLLKMGEVKNNPAELIKSLKTKKQIPHFISESAIHTIIPPTADQPISYAEVLDSTLLLALYHTGFRRSELASLGTDNIDMAANVIKIKGKGGKERIVPMTAQLREAIITLEDEKKKHNIFCTSPKNLLFLTKQSKPVNDQYIYRIVHRMLKIAGVSGKCSPHIFRHTFATHLLSKGASIRHIQQLLGHSSLSTTQKYTHTSIEQLKAQHAAAHPRAKK